jgi:hypothetical protein
MIQRPASAGASIAPASAEQGEVALTTPALPVAPASPGTATPRTSTVLAGIGPDPALAPPGPPKLADRTRARLGHTTPRSSARGTPRAITTVEGMTYRLVFACCLQATDAPTE